jgi:hypothetical protein
MSSPKVGNSNPLDVIRNLDTINCGKDAATHFLHDTNYTNLNHGMYGLFLFISISLVNYL